MTVVNLGTITPNKTSLFKVSASTTQEGINITYLLVSGQLPPGLSITQDGEIVGKCGNIKNETTYVFTVRANGQFGNIFSNQQFAIKVVPVTTDDIANMYGRLQIGTSDLQSWKNFVTDNNTFPTASLYRPSSDEFNTTIPKFLFLAGIHTTRLSLIQNLLLNNNYNTVLYMGEFKLAKAKSRGGNVIYEVIYCDLIDPHAGANDTINLSSSNLPSIPISFSTDAQQWFTDNGLPVPTGGADTLYSNAITRMQNEIKAGVTIDLFEYLPRWMTSSQNDGITPGYKLALPIKFVKPGEGEKILYKVQNESNFDIKKIRCFVDRWFIDKNIGTIFDSDTTTFNTSSFPPTADTTLFTADDTDYITNSLTVFDDATTTFDGDGTRFIKGTVTFDKRTPQDAQLMFNRTAVTDRITHISRQRELVRTP